MHDGEMCGYWMDEKLIALNNTPASSPGMPNADLSDWNDPEVFIYFGDHLHP